MTAELVWITIHGKRVLPVQGAPGMCGTGGMREERINCASYVMGSGDCCTTNDKQEYACETDMFPDNTIFITEDQLPEYLGRKLLGEL